LTLRRPAWFNELFMNENIALEQRGWLRRNSPGIVGLLLLLGSPLPAVEKEKEKNKLPTPKIVSLYPLGARRGTGFEITIRGADLAGARAMLFDGVGLSARVLSVQSEPPAPGETASTVDLLRADISVAPEAAPGWHKFRVVTPNGVTNQLKAMVVDEPVLLDAGRGKPLRQFPIVLNGRVAERGESEMYRIEAESGQTLTFEVISGFDTFDPTLTLYEQSGSWFDPHRLNRLAFNDEPLSYAGYSTNPRLSWRFARAGEYCLKVEAFAGQGSPDYSYQLRVTNGAESSGLLHPEPVADWDERLFTRRLSADWLAELSRRGGNEQKPESPERFHAVPEGSMDVPVMTAPGLVEGRIAHPGESHVIRLKVEKAENLVLEVETPQRTLPAFDPVVRVLEPGGREMGTDVYTKLNQGVDLVKMLEARALLSLQAPGEYTIQIHDIAADRGGPDFVYRVLVRHRIPHVGKVMVAPDQINLEPGSTEGIKVTIEREEGFQGFVTVNVEGLPSGVTATPAMQNPPLKLPSLVINGGMPERYFAPDQETAILLAVAPGAPLTPLPSNARVVVRVIGTGASSQVIASKEVPVMVVSRKPL
jgi:hypothetical protein